MNERKIGIFNKKRLKGNNLTRSEGSSCGDPGNCEQVEQNLERVAVHVYQHPQSTHRHSDLTGFFSFIIKIYLDCVTQVSEACKALFKESIMSHSKMFKKLL